MGWKLDDSSNPIGFRLLGNRRNSFSLSILFICYLFRKI